jgi:hypothetical protein
MPADFRLVMHATQTDPDELAPDRSRNGLPERRLANTRRPDKAKDWSLALGVQLPDGEEFQNPTLDLLQVEMVLVQHPARGGNVDRRLVLNAPGQFRQPLQIGPHHAGFRGTFGHPLQPPQLALRLAGDLGRHAGLIQLALQLVKFGRGIVGLAQFFLNGLQLFAQQELSLAPFHRRAGLLAYVV